MSEGKIRSVQFANQFYPAGPERLQRDVDFFLEAVQADSHFKKFSNLRVLLVPHAGYPYSGQVAAYGYSQLNSQRIKRVILLGVAHADFADRACLSTAEAWQTPLGQVKLDVQMLNSLAALAEFEFNDEVHQHEHSLEVQLPFLQTVLTAEVKIAPILLGQIADNKLQSIAQILQKYLDAETLLVISTDLAHYPPVDLAEQADRETIEAILSGEPGLFKSVVKKIQPTQALQTRACAQQAIEIGLRLAENWPEKEIRLLRYANSATVSGDTQRVVGYAAMGIFSENLDADNQARDEKRQKILQKIAGQAIKKVVTGEKVQGLSVDEQNLVTDLLKQKLGVFVTLRKNGQLRGCIGNVEPEENLAVMLPKMAQAAAVDDTRFEPVKVEELTELEIKVSLLSKPREIQDINEIELGKHGVILECDGRRGVYLPEVAIEQGFSREELLDSLCQHKMGLKKGCWRGGRVFLIPGF